MSPKRKAAVRKGKSSIEPSDDSLPPLASTSAMPTTSVVHPAWQADTISTDALDSSSLGQFKRLYLSKLREALDSSLSPDDAVEQLWRDMPSLAEGSSARDVQPTIVERALETIVSEQVCPASFLLTSRCDGRTGQR
jgi:hypothetical protein